MENKWISVKDNLPKSGQEVLTCYYDGVSERHEINILTYFKAGDIMYSAIDRQTDPKKHLKTWLANTLFNPDFQIKAGEDGFYLYEWNEAGDTCCRKHADIITHWQALPEPPNEK